ncbi:hypothetical protein SISNIDRAFT_420802, partial [Sistotremastrum niveocremeum HHB9708]
MGVIDPECSKLPARTFEAAALRSLVGDETKGPDLYIRHGSQLVSDYNNPALFPGMFPTLFPLGINGFDEPARPRPISLRAQAEYYLDTDAKVFRQHRFFIFAALNVHYRHLAHWRIGMSVKQRDWDFVAAEIAQLDPETIHAVADHIEAEGTRQGLDEKQQKVFKLLNRVNTITSQLPGSHASKVKARNDIRAYFSFFGLGHVFVTMNTNALHCPIFHVMYGDESVDLSARYPVMPDVSERARRLNDDPVAAADFFEFMCEMFLNVMCGWDPITAKSKPEGGLLGHLKAYYGTAE